MKLDLKYNLCLYSQDESKSLVALWPLKNGTNIIGNDPNESNIVLDISSIEAKHVKIILDPPYIQVQDLHDNQGTLVYFLFV